MSHNSRTVAIVGAGIFGLSLAVALKEKGHDVIVFDRNQYDTNHYHPDDSEKVQAASVDHNKIFRASYGKKLHYQRLAMESREAWIHLNHKSEEALFVPSGMLRVQPTDELGALEKETLANMERDGFRETQFVKSDEKDRNRASSLGWYHKLLNFHIPETEDQKCFDAVLDTLGGFTNCSAACFFYHKLAVSLGVNFVFGRQEGRVLRFVEEPSSIDEARKKVVGLQTKDGKAHAADVVVVAAGSFSTQLLPCLSYHIESSAGSTVTFKVDPSNKALWDKYSPENFPVITWKSAARDKDGKDMGSIYVFPRTEHGLIKIGYRGIKFTNFEKAPQGVPFTQDGQWSVPLPYHDCKAVPPRAREAIRTFVSIFLPEFANEAFHTTKLCWYTDTLDNSFLIDYVPQYAENSVFVCTGGSGHGAKFLPVLGQHAADIFENSNDAKSHMREHWKWRDSAPRRNGLEEGPDGPRNIGNGSMN